MNDEQDEQGAGAQDANEQEQVEELRKVLAADASKHLQFAYDDLVETHGKDWGFCLIAVEKKMQGTIMCKSGIPHGMLPTLFSAVIAVLGTKDRAERRIIMPNGGGEN